MATVPTISTNVYPVTIQSSGNQALSYPDILAGLGNFNYKLNRLLIVSDAINNAQANISFQKVDANGTSSVFPITVVANLFQSVPQVNIDLQDEGIVFNGQMFLNTTINPNTSVSYFMYMQENSVTSLLSK